MDTTQLKENEAEAIGPKEQAYQAEIVPLIDQIAALCDKAGISVFMVFRLDETDKAEMRTGFTHGIFDSNDIMAFNMLGIRPESEPLITH